MVTYCITTPAVLCCAETTVFDGKKRVFIVKYRDHKAFYGKIQITAISRNDAIRQVCQLLTVSRYCDGLNDHTPLSDYANYSKNYRGQFLATLNLAEDWESENGLDPVL